MKKKLLLIISIYLFLTIVNCKKEENKNVVTEASAMVLFVVGDAKVNGQQLKVGDSVKSNQIVSVGEKSTVDLQIIDSQNPVTVRVKQKSQFELKVIKKGDETKFQGVVSTGEAFFNVDKQKAKNEKFEAVTPSSVAGVRGTKFDVAVSEKGDVKTSVYEGSVAARVRIPEIENLSQDQIDKSPALSKLIAEMEKKEAVLDQGKSSEVSKSQSDKILQDSGLADLVKDPSKLEEASSKIDLAGLEQKLAKLDASPTKSDVDASEMKSKLEESKELTPIDSAKLTSNRAEAIKERELLNTEIKKKKIAAASTKLKLKNGKIVEGLVIQENGKYRIITAEGEQEYKETDIQEIVF